MSVPAVSILMPVRNEEKYLRQALDSLFRQSLREWELVAVDDHSEDATPALLAEAAADARVRVVAPRGRGLVAALNEGLTRCRAPLVARMDGDDISHPRRLERQKDLLDRNPEIGLVATSFRHFPRSCVKIGMHRYEQWQNSLVSHDLVMRDLFVESPFVHPSVMFRCAEVEAAGGYRDAGWAEDYDLWLRLAARGCRFARLPEELFFWRDRPERATRTLGEYSAEAFRTCKAHHLRRTVLRGCDAVTLAGAGKEGRAWRRALEREGIRVAQWIDLDPRKVGRTLHGAAVVGPADFVAGDATVLATVGTPGVRETVRQWAKTTGLREGFDFYCVT